MSNPNPYTNHNDKTDNTNYINHPDNTSNQAVSASSWKTYLNKKVLALILLGFSSGMPYYFLANLMQVWLAESGLDVKALGLMGLVMIPYPWKFVWAPFMDRYTIPFIGRRRGWMLITQATLLFLMGSLGSLSPKTELGLIIAVLALIAFFSASQDIVLDAFTREILRDEEQGLGAAVKVNAYKASTFVPGSLALILAGAYHMSWASVFWITGGFMLLGVIGTFVLREPSHYGAPPKNLQEAVVLPFKEFISRKGLQHALLILLFIFLYRIGDSMASSLASKFFLDVGFKKEEIGAIAKIAMFWGSLAGGVVGAVWMIRLGVNRALWVFGVAQALSILGFVVLAQSGPNSYLLAGVMFFETFGVGLGMAAFVGFIARETDPRYTATQFALFTSLAAVPRNIITSLGGFVVAEVGWTLFFIISFILAIPGMLLLYKVAPWHTQEVTPKPST